MLLTNLTHGGVTLGDKAYDTDWIRKTIEIQGATPNIPDKVNRKASSSFLQSSVQRA